MPRNEDGEFELVLGNRQLLSGFFVVVILFGVFFTMGYVVGRHSTPSTVAPGGTATAAGPPLTSAEPPLIDLPPGQAEVVSPPKATPSSTAAATSPGDPPKPAQEIRRPEPAKPETKKTEAVALDPPALTGPRKGAQYYQVSAPKRAAAEGVMSALRSKGFKPMQVAGPDADTVRILVGPVETGETTKTKTKLEDAGFKNPWLRKF